MSEASLARDRCGARREEGESLARNESGAILVIGVFMAIVLVGLLYYVAGIGTTIFHRERMQDAADAVALATAIGHARGMNLIVFINLVMAALVAVVLALKVIEMLLTGLTLILTGISWFFPPAAAAIPIVNAARQTVSTVHDTARQIVDAILIVLHYSEHAVKYVTPAVSVTTAALTVGEAYNDVATVTVAIPPRLTLPVEDDVYDRLCKEAEKMLGRLVTDATSAVPLIGEVIGSVMNGIIRGVSAAYCYRNGSPPSGIEVEFDRTLPITANGMTCEEDRAQMNAQSSACQAWDDEIEARRPEDGTFDCAPNNRACIDNLFTARQQCNPARRPRANNYSWVEQNVEEVVEYNPVLGNWQTVSFDYVGEAVPYNVDTGSSPVPTLPAGFPSEVTDAAGGKPCDQGNLYLLRNSWDVEPTPEQRAQFWSDWNEVVNEPPDVKPVCDRRLRAVLDVLPDLPPDPRNPPEGFPRGPYTLNYPAVKNVFACSEKAKRQMEFPDSWSQGGTGDGDNKTPQKMEEGVNLGDGDFQMRGFAIDPTLAKQPNLARRQLNVSAFNRDTTPEGWVPIARGAGGVAVAQAEYFYNHNGTEDRDLWMWEMKWKARLVRFTLPGGDDEEQDQGNTDVAGIDIPGGVPSMDLGEVQRQLPGNSPNLDVIADLIVH